MKRSGFIASMAALLLAATAAAAQEKPAPALEEIVVTAMKRASTVQTTPVSITVLGAKTLATTHADDFADFAKLVPGLTATDLGPGNKRYALRGLQSPGEPEVALYYDEIPISGLPGGSLDTGAAQLDLKLFDTNRIEVLRGPEGTLYGNGSEGGAIRIISNLPVLDRIEGDTEITGGATQGGAPSFGINQMFNLPVVDNKFAVRLALYYRNEGGWIDDKYQPAIALPQINEKNLNDEVTWGGRLSMSWQVNDDWNITNITYYQHMHTENSFELYPDFAQPNDRYESKAFVRTPWTDEAAMDDLISTYELPWASFVATGAYQFRRVDTPVDTTRYLLSLFGCTIYNWHRGCTGPNDLPAAGDAKEQVSAWSGEMRLVSKSGSRLQWTIGTALQDARDFRLSQVAKTDPGGYIDYDSAGDAENRLFARSNVDYFDQYSFFGNAGYEILHGLTLSAGLRWFHSYRSDEQTVIQQFFPGSPIGAEPFQSFSQGALFKSFELSYAFSPTALAYLQASQGFRAGGPNYPGGFTETAPPYGADSVWDYEAGLKLALLDHRLTWDSALFRIDWSNLQVILPRANFSYISNAGNARSQGFESELHAELWRGLSTSLGVSYNDAQLVGPQPDSGNPATRLQAGDRLAGVPRWTSNASLIYETHLSPHYTATGRLDLTSQSSRTSVVPPQNPAYFVTSPYALVDMHMRVDRDDGWGASIDVDNLFNSYAELSAQSDDANLVRSITAARPLTVTLGVSKRF